MSQEYVSGNHYEILVEGNCVDGDCWRILNANNKLIVTLPKHIGEDKITEIMAEYENHQWGSYYLKFSKRFCVIISDGNVSKLEKCLENI